MTNILLLPPVAIIVATAARNAIGAKGSIPFRIKSDMKRFREITMGKPIVMGRRTFESLPNGALPGRRNIVVSRQPDYHPLGAEVASSLDEAVALAAETEPEEIMVIGGGEIYAQALPSTSRIYLTEIDADYPEADTFFPEIRMTDWVAEEASEPLTDENSGLGYRFITLRRRPAQEKE